MTTSGMGRISVDENVVLEAPQLRFVHKGFWFWFWFGLVWFGLFILDTIRVTPQRASQASKA